MFGKLQKWHKNAGLLNLTLCDLAKPFIEKMPGSHTSVSQKQMGHFLSIVSKTELRGCNKIPLFIRNLFVYTEFYSWSFSNMKMFFAFIQNKQMNEQKDGGREENKRKGKKGCEQFSFLVNFF